MPALPVREYHHLGTLLPDHARSLQAVLPRVLDAAIGNVKRIPPRNLQYAGSIGSFTSAVVRRSPGAHLALCEIEDAGAVSAVSHLEESAAASLLDIITMRGEGDDVESGDFHGCVERRWSLGKSI